MIKDREWLNEELTKLGCRCYPSYANFVFFETPYPAADVAEQLLQKGIIVRPCGGWGYDKHLRVSIGTTEQNKQFLQGIQEVFDAMK